MTPRPTLFLLLLAGIQLPALAAADAATAAARYEADRRLCADESNSSARMQCLRDARAEYDRALGASAGAAAPVAAPAAAQVAPAAACADCGRVLAVTVSESEGKGGALGVIGGGIAGALLGHQVGGGRGKDLATIAGAAGGAYAGHKLEEKMTAGKTWTVRVKLDSGGERSLTLDKDPGLAAGDLVRVTGNGIVRR